jgi:hypothetical protein
MSARPRGERDPSVDVAAPLSGQLKHALASTTALITLDGS